MGENFRVFPRFVGNTPNKYEKTAYFLDGLGLNPKK